MLATIIIFCIAIITAFGMLSFRAWEIRTSRVVLMTGTENPTPKFEFRQVEKIMLYLTKHVIQWIVLTTAKYWFTVTTKTKKWLEDKWPKVYAYFHKKADSPAIAKPSFFNRTILESKAKIKRIKEKVKKEHAEKQEEQDLENKI